MSTVTALDPRSATQTLAAAMRGLERRFEAVADNLANLETPGHKRCVATSHLASPSSSAGSFAAEVDRAQEQQTTVTRDYSQGDLVASGDPNDLALDAQGFFAIQVDDQPRYIRAANASKDLAGTLTDGHGALLLGESGPIRLPTPTSTLAVDADGTVISDGQPVGKLRVVTFVTPELLEAEGHGRFKVPDDAELVIPKETHVLQGMRERSNSNPIQELVEMIVVQRQYEAAQRALSTESELRQRLNELSR